MAYSATSVCAARAAPARLASCTVALPRLTKAILLRMLVAGSSWGLVLAGGLIFTRFRDTGLVCIDDVIWTTTAALLGGNLLFGPLVVLGTDVRLCLKHKQ